jgi:hypothetical protein
MGWRSRALLVAAGLAWVCTNATARAQAPASPVAPSPTDQDKAAATALFDDARSLLADGKVAEACRKLEESRRLAPVTGTVLNLATCHEREGLTASAAAEFREARALAEHDHRDDRVAFAEEHLRALEPRLSTLLIVVPPEADVPGLGVTRDGVALGRAAWGTRIPVDPGTHVLVATAPGKTPWRLEVRVGPEADAQTATVARLEDVTPPPLPVAPPPPVEAAKPPPPPPDVVPPPPHGLSTRRTWALAAGGAGVLGVGAGSVLGIVAIDKHHANGAVCTASPCSQSYTLNDQAKTAADGSTIAFSVGLVALGVGAFLWFGDSVAVAPGVGRLDVTGRF